MDITPPEHRKVHVTYGKHPAGVVPGQGTHGLHQLAELRPFTQQEHAAREKFGRLTTTYKSRQWTLGAFAGFAAPRVRQASTGYLAHSDVVALGKPGPLDDDVWCLDTRGCITLAVGTTTYQSLGLVGHPLPWKEHSETYIIRVSLLAQPVKLKNQQCHPYNSKVKAALKAWDERRGSWDVIYHESTSSDADADGEETIHEVQPIIRAIQNIHIPQPKLREEPKNGGEDEDGWQEEVEELLEWVGLASLGSSRLKVTDRCDPYVAVYTPPSTSAAGDLVHIRWTGFIPITLVQSIIDVAVTIPFACLAGNSIPLSPVTVVPTRTTTVYPCRAPRRDSEDSWCLVITAQGEEGGAQYIMAESVGRWDSRWG